MFTNPVSRIGFFLGPLMAIAAWIAPVNLTPEGHKLLGILLWVGCWWVTEPVPLPVTGMFGSCLAVVMGVTTAQKSFSPYAHPLIFLFMGGFFIAKSMSVHGLDRRIALVILTRNFIGDHPWRILSALLCLVAFTSMWISNTAVAAMFYPITLGILNAMTPGDTKSRGYILIAVAYASSIGGIATPVGTPPNILALGMLDQLAGIKISFLNYMAFGFPTMILCMAGLLWITKRKMPKFKKSIDVSFLEKELKNLGPMSEGARNTMLVALVAVTCWIGPGLVGIIYGEDHVFTKWFGAHIPESIGSIFSACLLFMLPASRARATLQWKEAATIDWNSLLLFGGGLSLGTMMFETGIAQGAGSLLSGIAGPEGGVLLLLAAVVLTGIFLSEFTSNTATANMLVPLVIGASQQAGMNPVGPVIAAAFGCSLSFMMPVGTPPNAIVYGSGEVTMRQMLSQGLFMDIFCAIVIIAMTVFVGTSIFG